MSLIIFALFFVIINIFLLNFAKNNSIDNNRNIYLDLNNIKIGKAKTLRRFVSNSMLEEKRNYLKNSKF